MITIIGNWKIDKNGLTMKVNPSYNYNIAKNRLWEITDYQGHFVWSWLIHLTEKDWITKSNIHELNTAFFFGQDYFKKLKPIDIPNASTAQTIYLQQQLMNIQEQMRKNEDPKDGIVRLTEEVAENIIKHSQLKSQIKFLKF